MLKMLGTIAVLAVAPVSWGQDLGEISLELEQGVYFRGAMLINSYSDADADFGAFEQSIDFDTAIGGSLALGYYRSRGNKGFRIEGELMREDVDAELEETSAEAEFTSLAVNAYFDYKIDTKITWYIGGGLGDSAVDASTEFGTADGEGGFVQFMTGFELEINGPLSVYGGIRLRGYDTINLEDNFDNNIDIEGLGSAGVEFGLMLRF